MAKGTAGTPFALTSEASLSAFFLVWMHIFGLTDWIRLEEKPFWPPGSEWLVRDNRLWRLVEL